MSVIITSPFGRAGSVLRRIGIGALAAATVASGAVALASPASAASSSSVARYGAGWLADQLKAGGGHLDSFGVADPSDTAYAVIGLRAAGVGKTQSDQALAYLETQLGDALSTDDGTDNPGLLSYYILAAVSSGRSPYHFGGTKAANNLVTRLLATVRKSGADAGLVGTSDPTYDGTFRDGLALTALKAAGVPSSNKSVKAAIHWLVSQQCGNGLWESYRSDLTTPCATADPDTFAGPDTNSSALALEGLSAYKIYAHRATTKASFRLIQSADGGFPYIAAPGQASDPDSTALTIQGLLATGVSVTSWKKASATPFTALASYQLGCSDAPGDQGAFFYPGDRSANLLATVQSVPAAAGVTFAAIAPRASSTAIPHPTCSAGSAAPASASSASSLRLAATTLAGTAGPCPGKTGVTVSVDFTAFGKGVQTRCAPGTPATGVAALQQAGFTPAGTTQYGLAFVCRINSLPSTAQQACVRTPPATAYWAYYHANAGATAWTFSTTGAASYKPLQGSIDAWAFGNAAKPSKTPAQVRAGK